MGVFVKERLALDTRRYCNKIFWSFVAEFCDKKGLREHYKKKDHDNKGRLCSQEIKLKNNVEEKQKTQRIQRKVMIEDHQHLQGEHASIHPCKPARVMNKIIYVILSSGAEPEVDKYPFLFQKFVAFMKSLPHSVPLLYKIKEN
ncbi:Autophagy-related protein 3 [Acorus calamus]|uniref:Autophagy-related protein 3 n=1 Tax=Acorus calamus TaxID=4465 RepID=A0AAV9DEF4_ACOCL|nr:Autophagy-related protein 3 [Acorus calamus]